MRCTAFGPRILTLIAVMALAGCSKEESVDPAPTAAALEAAKPKSIQAAALEISKDSSQVSFVMDAPLEKIRGKLIGTTTGTIQVDPSDITRSNGLIRIDIGDIELFQTVADDNGRFGDEKKSEVQNQHARAWLEISDDTPPAIRRENQVVEYKIDEVQDVSVKDLTRLTGPTRTVTARVTGDLRLHRRKVKKSARVEVTFRYAGDRLESATFKTVEPVMVSLDEHDVRPREAFGKLAQKTLAALSPKVAKEAQVSFALQARVKQSK
jgi:hypothetical protein